MGDFSIRRSIITSSDDTLIPPSEFTTPEQLAILETPERCDLLGIIHHKEFYRTQARSDLENAIFCARKVAETCPKEDPLRKKYLFRLGNWLASFCDRYGDIAGLHEALEFLKECLEEDEGRDSGNLEGGRRADALGCVARCHRLLYLENESESDFDASVKANEMSYDIYSDLEADKKIATAERALAIVYEDRYKKTKDSTEHLNKAIEEARYAIWSSERFDSWEDCMRSLSGLYEDRYIASVKEEDEEVFQEAIEYWEDLFVDQESEKHKVAYQFEIGRAYFHLTKITKSSDDGIEASSNIRRAIQSTPNDDPARPKRMRLWDECFEFLSNTVGFDFRGCATEAEIKAKRRHLYRLESEKDKAKLLEELAFMRYARYQSTEATSEVIAANNALEESVGLTPEDDDEDRVRRLRTIAFFCQDLYKEKDNPRYLDEGIPWARKAAKVCEDSEKIDNPLKALTLHTLARMLSDKVDEDSFGDHVLMKEAVDYGKKAVELISEECNEDDNCEYCEDRKMFLRDLESFQRTYDRASGISSRTDDGQGSSRTGEGEG